jgi:hypothetical protein
LTLNKKFRKFESFDI